MFSALKALLDANDEEECAAPKMPSPQTFASIPTTSANASDLFTISLSSHDLESLPSPTASALKYKLQEAPSNASRLKDMLQKRASSLAEDFARTIDFSQSALRVAEFIPNPPTKLWIETINPPIMWAIMEEVEQKNFIRRAFGAINSLGIIVKTSAILLIESDADDETVEIALTRITSALDHIIAMTVKAEEGHQANLQAFETHTARLFEITVPRGVERFKLHQFELEQEIEKFEVLEKGLKDTNECLERTVMETEIVNLRKQLTSLEKEEADLYDTIGLTGEFLILCLSEIKEFLSKWSFGDIYKRLAWMLEEITVLLKDELDLLRKKKKRCFELVGRRLLQSCGPLSAFNIEAIDSMLCEKSTKKFISFE